ALVNPAGPPVGVAVAEAASAPASATYAMRQADIDRLCGGDSVADVQAALHGADDAPWAERAARDIEKRSPLALVAFLAAVRGARDLESLEEALNIEFRLSTRFYASGEMLEGVRALIIDKDRAPVWRFATAEAVTDDAVAELFAPLTERDELGLTPPA
ncbi:MAG: enoyl-CoA hydratase/isomerase family protein, partial [Pseudomonadota bacterium]